MDVSPCIPADLEPRPPHDLVAFAHLAWWRGRFPTESGPDTLATLDSLSARPAPDCPQLGLPFSALPMCL